MVTPNRLLDLAPGVGVIASGVEWQLTDDTGRVLGKLNPQRGSASISFDAGANITRQLGGLVIAAEDFAHINPYRDRVAPLWVLEDGSRWPLGRFYFTGAPGNAITVDTTTLYDVGLVLDTLSLRPYGVEAGGRLYDAMVGVFHELGVQDFHVDDTPAITGTPIAWPIGTSWLQILRALGDLGGFIPPYSDNNGTAVMRRVDPIDVDHAQFAYGADIGRVVHGSTTLNPNLLDAPNAHVVLDSGATDAPVFAIAYVDPTLPWSKENRGFVISAVHNIQGIESTQAAQTMANGFASAGPDSFEEITFESPIDPRHDGFMVGTVNGIAYREVHWDIQMEAGGVMNHRLVRSGVTGRG